MPEDRIIATELGASRIIRTISETTPCTCDAIIGTDRWYNTRTRAKNWQRLPIASRRRTNALTVQRTVIQLRLSVLLHRLHPLYDFTWRVLVLIRDPSISFSFRRWKNTSERVVFQKRCEKRFFNDFIFYLRQALKISAVFFEGSWYTCHKCVTNQWHIYCGIPW